MDNKGSLLQNVHKNIKLPTAYGVTTMFRGLYHYYHYGCDGFNDKVRPDTNIVKFCIPIL